jgi:hypothetical protein
VDQGTGLDTVPTVSLVAADASATAFHPTEAAEAAAAKGGGTVAGSSRLKAERIPTEALADSLSHGEEEEGETVTGDVGMPAGKLKAEHMVEEEERNDVGETALVASVQVPEVKLYRDCSCVNPDDIFEGFAFRSNGYYARSTGVDTDLNSVSIPVGMA